MRDRRRALLAAADVSPYEHGTWEDLFWCIDHGCHAAKYDLGEVLPLDLGSLGEVNAQIVAFDADERTDGNGFAAITFITQHTLKIADKRMNSGLAGEEGNYTGGTGAIGGWEQCEIRTYCRSTVKQAIPAEIRARIAEVWKTCASFDTTGARTYPSPIADDVWIPSNREIGASRNVTREQSGPIYDSVFLYANSSRRKTNPDSSSGRYWSTRTAQGVLGFGQVGSDGSIASTQAEYAQGLAIGFCIA